MGGMVLETNINQILTAINDQTRLHAASNKVGLPPSGGISAHGRSRPAGGGGGAEFQESLGCEHDDSSMVLLGNTRSLALPERCRCSLGERSLLHSRGIGAWSEPSNRHGW